MNLNKAWLSTPDGAAPSQGSSGAELESLRQDPGYLEHLYLKRTEREQQALLAGPLVPTQTRTTQVATGLQVLHLNGETSAEQAIGRLTIPKGKVKQYVVSQDDFRRYGKNFTMRAAGTTPNTFKKRIANRTVQTEYYGLRTFATGHDISEADEGLNVLDIEQMGIETVLNAEIEHQWVTHITTSTNYGTGHSVTLGTPWANAAGDPIGDIITGQNVIGLDCGQLIGGEWVLVMGWDGYDTLRQNADIQTKWGKATTGQGGGALPDAGWLASAVGVDRIVVSTMSTGPDPQTTAWPVVTSNTRIWPAATDSAALLYVDKGVSAVGSATNGQFSACHMISQYGRMNDSYVGSPDTRGPEGEVEWRSVFDDFNFVAGAVDNVTNGYMIAGYLIADIIS